MSAETGGESAASEVGGPDTVPAGPAPGRESVADPIAPIRPDAQPRRAGAPVLEVTGVSVDFKPPGRPVVHAVKDATFVLHHGEILGVVGESGSGKSSLGRVLAGFTQPSAGTVRLIGRDGALHDMSIRANRGVRDVQMIFQESALALDPRLAVWRSVAEARRPGEPPTPGADGGGRPDASPLGRKAWALDHLAQVGLGPAIAGRRPSGLSGGEKQRVAIARAIAARPAVVVCDEAVSALDVTVRAAILALLRSIVAESGIALFFIAHDMSVVSTIADTTAVMFQGEIVELGPTRQVIDHPQHAYTKRLIDAVPPLQRGQVPA